MFFAPSEARLSGARVRTKKTDAIYSVRRSRVFTTIRAHALLYAALTIDIAISRALINVDYIDTVFTYDKLME